jgi:hypothetical protein
MNDYITPLIARKLIHIEINIIFNQLNCATSLGRGGRSIIVFAATRIDCKEFWDRDRISGCFLNGIVVV